MCRRLEHRPPQLRGERVPPEEPSAHRRRPPRGSHCCHRPLASVASALALRPPAERVRPPLRGPPLKETALLSAAHAPLRRALRPLAQRFYPNAATENVPRPRQVSPPPEGASKKHFRLRRLRAGAELTQRARRRRSGPSRPSDENLPQDPTAAVRRELRERVTRDSD
eukprot:7910402-Pyramimonas_sp.AAC.1